MRVKDHLGVPYPVGTRVTHTRVEGSAGTVTDAGDADDDGTTCFVKWDDAAEGEDPEPVFTSKLRKILETA